MWYKFLSVALIFFLNSNIALALDDFVPEDVENNISGTNSQNFTIDNNNLGQDIQLYFGESSNEYFSWNNTSFEFDLSDDLNLGDFELKAIRLENLSTPPVCNAGMTGKIYFDITLKNTLVCNGNTWSPLENKDRNFLDTASWTEGNGSAGNFLMNGDASENVREWGTNPYNERDILWKAVPDAVSGADGGWNFRDIPIDHTKGYRSMVWIKKTGSADGRTYLGAGQSGLTHNLNDTVNTNPYFWSGDLPELDKWYLLVGYIHGSSDPSTESLGGIYDGETGAKVLSMTDFKNAPTATTQTHRSYLFYNVDTNNRQYFWGPRFEEVNGSELPVSAFLPSSPSGSSSGGGIAPYIESVGNSVIAPNTTATILIRGHNFDYNTQVSIPSWEGSIDQIRFVSGQLIEVDVTAGATSQSYSVVLNNDTLDSTSFQTNYGLDALRVATSDWIDLRAGGASFTDGNAAGNDIRYRTGMGLVRDANGMSFTGSNPWTSWVKFESEQFTRGNNTNVEWIFRVNGAMMLGIAGVSTDETSTSQWQQGAVTAYFSTETNHWGYYGSSPSSGSTWSQSDSATVASGAILKLKIENDGSNGETMTLYQLPSADPADWDDESNVINTTVSTNVNTQTDLVPFIIPRASTTNYFVALKVE